MADLSLRAKLELYTDKFQKGINIAKKEMLGLKSAFSNFAASMGAGLGIYQIASQIASVTKELSSAKAVLSNVSDSQTAYNDSIQFASKLAKDYSQDMVSLIAQLGQFQAACKGSGLALDDVNNIYASIVKSATYFHLSSQQTEQALLAVQQMMSKGKISAQELRLQLGNVMPGAFQKMADAVGVSTAELDKMMAAGQLISKDVLPKFAAELDKMTAGKIDLNSLQLQINALKNAFAELVNSGGFEQAFSKVVKIATNAINVIKNNIKGIGEFIGSYLIGNIIGRLVRTITALSRLVGTNMVAAFKRMGAAARAAAMANIFTAIGTAISFIVMKVIQWRKEMDSVAKASRQAKQQMDDYMSTVNTNATTGLKEQKILLDAQLKLLKDTTLSEGERKKAINEIKNIIGEEQGKLIGIKSSYEDIVKVVNDWLTKEQKLAKVRAYAAAQADLESKKMQNENLLRQARTYGAEQATRRMAREKWAYGNNDYDNEQYVKRLGDYTEEFMDKFLKPMGLSVALITAQNKSYDAATKDLENKIVSLTDELAKIQLDNDGNGDENTDDTTGQKSIQTELDKYQEEVRKLSNQLKNNALTQEEYKSALKDLTDKTFKAVTGFDNLETELEKMPTEYQKLWDTIKQYFIQTNQDNATKSINDELERYQERLQQLNNLKANGLVTEKEYNDELSDLQVETYRTVAAFTELTDALMDMLGLAEIMEELRKEWNRQKSDNDLKNLAKTDINNIGLKSVGNVTSSSTRIDIEAEISNIQYNKNALQNAISLLQSEINNLDMSNWGDEYISQLDILKGKLKDMEGMEVNLSNLLKFKELGDGVEKAIEDFKNKIKQVPEELLSMGDAVKDVVQAFNPDADFTKWDEFAKKIRSVTNLLKQFNETKNLIQDVIGYIGAFFKIMKAGDDMEALTNVINDLADSQNKHKHSILQSIIASKMQDAQNKKNALSNVAVAATEDLKAKNTAKDAAAGAGNSVAHIPIVGAALAIAAIGAVTALLLTSFGKFAGGGIVKAPGVFGDRNLAQVNGGEMIMNGNQQQRLWNILNGSSSIGGNGGGEVRFRIRGAELEGVLENYKRTKKG